ncbi:MAG: hypothetical protein R3F23_00080 [Verrucomicrobiia bacterium]
MLSRLIRKAHRWLKNANHLDTVQDSLSAINQLFDQAKDLKNLADALGKTEELIAKMAELKKLHQNALAKAQAAYDKADDAARATGATIDATRVLDSAAMALNKTQEAGKALTELENILSTLQLRNPNNVEKAIEKVIATTEAANKAAALAATTGTALLLALLQHTLQSVGNTINDGVDKVLASAETIECLGGYNPLCILEDATIDSAV